MVGVKQYRLMDENGQFYMDTVPGKFGGYRRGRIYGRLDCKSANRAIAKGGYVKYRVFLRTRKPLSGQDTVRALCVCRRSTGSGKRKQDRGNEVGDFVIIFGFLLILNIEI